MKNLLVEILLRLLLGKFSDFPREKLTKEQEDGLMAQMWENPAFRNRIADRDLKILYTMAGGEGMLPEPREGYLLHAGQRIENLLWARDAKAAFMRLERLRKEKVAT